ncbi:MAG: hypothetical protein ACKPKO_02030 [Candidatus Fonsibacter sp.]
MKIQYRSTIGPIFQACVVVWSTNATLPPSACPTTLSIFGLAVEASSVFIYFSDSV